MVYIDLTVILTVILCVIIFGTGNLGLYITFRGNNINVITYRSSFVVFLGYYYILNYPRLLYMILSFLVYNSDFSQWYIIYTQCIYIIQAAFILFMSLSRFFALFKSKFTFASLAFTNMLAVLMVFLVGLYALDVYVFKDQSNIPRWIGMAIIVANVASAIFSLPGILAICCIRNFEKRQQIKLSVISFFMAAIYLIQLGVSLLVAYK
uniref:Uncharacterized protein n=1 Tax=Panagrolaimus davidi TaxID=227884 RepID=A0A914P1U3_9BILA